MTVLAEFDAVTGRALSRALQSLTDSSSLTVSVGALDWRADRLNSPYLSHQVINVDMRDEPVPHRLVLLSNGAYTVAVGPRVLDALPAAPAGYEWREAMIPAAPVHAVVARVAALVPGLAAEVRAALTDLGGTHLVTAVVLLRAVVAWDAAGRPVYAEPEPAPAADEPPSGIEEAWFTPDDDEEAAHHAA